MIAGTVPKQQLVIEAAELAQLLADEVVNKVVIDSAKYHIDASAVAQYEAKTRFYQLAVVLMALEKEERTNPGFGAAARHLESIFIPPSIDEKSTFLMKLAAAKQDLAVLVVFFAPEEQRREIVSKIPLMAGLPPSEASWARTWLLEIGVDELNPATCLLFALQWIDCIILVNDALRGFSPVSSSAAVAD